MHDHHFDPFDIEYRPPPVWLLLLAAAACVNLVGALVVALLPVPA